jgi:hypothetical protein
LKAEPSDIVTTVCVTAVPAGAVSETVGVGVKVTLLTVGATGGATLSVRVAGTEPPFCVAVTVNVCDPSSAEVRARDSARFDPTMPVGLIEIVPEKVEPSLMTTALEHTEVPSGELSGRDTVDGVRVIEVGTGGFGLLLATYPPFCQSHHKLAAVWTYNLPPLATSIRRPTPTLGWPFSTMLYSPGRPDAAAPHVHVPSVVTSAAPLGAADVVPSGERGAAEVTVTARLADTEDTPNGITAIDCAPSSAGVAARAVTTFNPDVANKLLLDVCKLPVYFDPSDMVTVAVDTTVPIGVLSGIDTVAGVREIPVGTGGGGVGGTTVTVRGD